MQIRKTTKIKILIGSIVDLTIPPFVSFADPCIHARVNRYSTQWYTAPLWMQKSLLLVMQRSGRKSALTAGGLFHASLEGFAMVSQRTPRDNYIFARVSRKGKTSIADHEHVHILRHAPYLDAGATEKTARRIIDTFNQLD